jgi:sugar/nucleoside kinase (ribokinase family)
MIAVLGDIAVDIVSTLRTSLARGSDAPAEVRPMPGGSGANVAVWLARLGQQVTFIGRLGDDLFGRWLEADLAAEGVKSALTVDASRRTAVIQVLVEPGGERTMVPDRGANAVWRGDEATEALIADAHLLHVVGYVMLDVESRRGALKAMQYARAHEVPISLDPSSHAPLARLGAEDFLSLTGPVTVLLPNRSEARVLGGEDDPHAAMDSLLSYASLVVIKMDREGCLAGTTRERWKIPAPQVQTVNATGAGDAFNAGFLARWLASGDVEDACRAGVALGTYATTLPETR